MLSAYHLRPFVLFGTLLLTAHVPAVRAQEPGYTRPQKAMKPDARSVEAILGAKTLANVGIDASVLRVTSVDPKNKKVYVTGGGGIRRGVDAEKARKSVEEKIREWGRFTVLDTVTDADLVLVVFEDTVEPSGFSKMQGDSKSRLRDTLAVFRGGDPPSSAQPLWAAVSTESTFGALTGSSAGKVASQWREDVEKLSKKK